MTTPASTSGRPRIGVALSSGGAAGLAHIGVLEELSEAGIEIECIAGTSAGAMVGAAFAANALEGFRDRMLRVTRRQMRTMFLDACWPRGGVLRARRAMEQIRPFLGGRIEDLPRRFAAVATDLAAGTPAYLCHGPVVDAVRASVAIPGIFTPQLWEGRLLVDGALVDPVPVAATRQLGADIVIAVSAIGVPLVAPRPLGSRAIWNRAIATWEKWRRLLDRMPVVEPMLAAAAEAVEGAAPAQAAISLTAILSRASIVVQANIAAARLRESPPDFSIDLDIADVGVFDFDRAARAIEVGRAAARAALPDLLAKLSERNAGRVGRWLRSAGPPPDARAA